MKKNLKLTCLLAALVTLATFGQASAFAAPPPQPQEEVPKIEEPILAEFGLFWAKSEPQQNTPICPEYCPAGLSGEEWTLCCPEGQACALGLDNPCTVYRVNSTYFCTRCGFDQGDYS